MSWLTGHWTGLGATAGKAALMYATALIALRLGERRTLAQWTIVDFVAAVAIGAVVGRTSIASSQSFITGAVALVTLVFAHRVASLLRLGPVAGRLMDHPVRVLVVRGRVRKDQLRRCGLTDADLFAHLRRQRIFDLSGIRFVLYESTGDLTVVSEDVAPPAALIDEALRNAAGWHPSGE